MAASGDHAGRTDARRRLRILEPISFSVLVLLYIWVVQPTGNGWLRIPFLTVTALLPLASNFTHGDSLKEMGIRLDNLAQSARETGLVTLAAAIVIVAVGYGVNGSLRWSPATSHRLLFYPFWGLAQQYALQSFVYRRFREGLGNPWLACFSAAALFAVIHWPNRLLVLLALAGGLVWCRLFERQPNLFTLALSHGVTAVLLFDICPEAWLHHLRIGPRYFH